MTRLLHLPINIEVRDHIAIIGPNGVGKTTLIKTIAQRQNQLEGEITFGKSSNWLLRSKAS